MNERYSITLRRDTVDFQQETDPNTAATSSNRSNKLFYHSNECSQSAVSFG